nr:hypothetical protein OH820_18705 [Streptomyces sp. NBC_00857]
MDFSERPASFASRRYRALRQSQVRVLGGYVQHAEDPDVAIELPTGFGKRAASAAPWGSR